MQKYLRKLLVLLVIILVGFLLIFVLFDIFYNRMILPSDLVSKANLLFESPSKIPDWIRIDPPAGSVLKQGQPIEIKLFVCHLGADSKNCDESSLRIKGDSYESVGLYREWSNFYVNGQPTKFLMYAGGGSIVGTITGSSLMMELHPILFAGYHLFKFEPAKSPEEQNNPNLSYEWAYRVE